MSQYFVLKKENNHFLKRILCCVFLVCFLGFSHKLEERVVACGPSFTLVRAAGWHSWTISGGREDARAAAVAAWKLIHLIVELKSERGLSSLSS